MTDKSLFPKALLDDLSKLAQNAAGVAQGARDEIDNALRGRLERWMNDGGFVSREEFEAVKEMAAKARDENEKLAARIEALEQRFGGR